MFQKIILLISALLISSCAARQSKDEVRARHHLKMGTAHLVQGQYPLALAELLKAHRLDSDNPVILNNLGLAYFVRKKYNLAAKFIRKAIKFEPAYTDAKNNLGRVYIAQEKHNKALSILQEAAADLTFPQPQKIQANIGVAHFELGNYAQAENILRKALRSGADDCRIRIFYGRSLVEQEEYKVAGLALDQAIKKCSKQRIAEPYYFSAFAYYMAGQPRQARARIEELLGKDPHSEYEKRARKLLSMLEKN